MGSTDLLVDLVRALSRMSGYEDGFFQTGRNNAEARFWKLKIHEEVDRRQTKSSISLGGHSSGASSREGSEQPREKSPSPYSKYNQMPAEPCDYKYSYAQPETEYSQDYHTYYPDPRDRSFSIRARPFTDYKYSYPQEIEEENEDECEDKQEDDPQKHKNNEKPTDAHKDEDKYKEEGKVEKYYPKDGGIMKTICEKQEQQSSDYISSRFY